MSKMFELKGITRLRAIFAGSLVFVLVIGVQVSGVSAATLPQAPSVFNTDVAPPSTGRILHADPGTLQKILDDPSTVPGDIVELTPNATYPTIRLPKKNAVGDMYLVIRSAAANPASSAGFAPAGTRVQTSQSNLMPKFFSTDKSLAIQTDEGANHYWLIGIEVAPESGISNNHMNMIAIGKYGAATNQADHIVLDRVYIHGNPEKEVGRAVALNGSNLAIINSVINEIHNYVYKNWNTPHFEAQAIAMWNGSGPYTIKNNTLSASTQEILVGGSTSCSAAMVPSDIVISNNYFYKPLAWRSTADPHWWVKNHLELKTGRRVVINGNYFENNWKDPFGDQNGASILFVPMNQVEAGMCVNNATDNPWSEVSDVAFTNNKVVNSGRFMEISGSDATRSSQQTGRVLIDNNLIYGKGKKEELSPDVSATGWGDGRFLTIVSGRNYATRDITVENNTVVQNGAILFGGSPEPEPPITQVKPHQNIVFTNNVVRWRGINYTPTGGQGVGGTGAVEGYGTNSSTVKISAFKTYFPSMLFNNNIIAATSLEAQSAYNQNGLNNHFILDPIFNNSASNDYHLAVNALIPANSAGIKNWEAIVAADDARNNLVTAIALLSSPTATPPLTPSTLTTTPPEIPRSPLAVPQESLAATPATVTPKFIWQRNLAYGYWGSDVCALQQFLNQRGFILSASGYGSPGHETNFFGPRTRAALGRFQATNGIAQERGWLGWRTRQAAGSVQN